MSRREWLGAIIVTGYWLATVLTHLQVALWLVRRRESELLGTWRVADFLPHAASLAVLGVLLWQGARAWRGRQRIATLLLWLAWLAIIVVIDRLLLFSFPEYLHYPQYALLAMLLAWFVDRDRRGHAIAPILLAVTLLGIADEALQYVWITISYSNYLDFNDFLLNMVGGMAGLLLYYGFPRKPLQAPSPTAAQYAVLGWLALGTAMLLAISALQIAADGATLPWIERTPSYGQWITSQRSERYYVLPPTAGTLLLALPGLMISLWASRPPCRHSHRATSAVC